MQTRPQRAAPQPRTSLLPEELHIHTSATGKGVFFLFHERGGDTVASFLFFMLHNTKAVVERWVSTFQMQHYYFESFWFL